jgi:hypothetical protein
VRYSPGWANPPLRLYHGTLEANARSIVSVGVSVARGRPGTDFGPGFYTTSDPDVAEEWAWRFESKRHRRRTAVVAADLDRDSLASLSWLSFVRGDEGADDFWSFVAHCRSSVPHHGRSARTARLYDAVMGPVVAILNQRVCIADTDQISFHTPAAQAVLNSAQWRFA